MKIKEKGHYRIKTIVSSSDTNTEYGIVGLGCFNGTCYLYERNTGKYLDNLKVES